MKIKDAKEFIRDITTNAVIYSDNLEYELYKKKKEIELKKLQKSEHLENEINIMKAELNDIKQLLIKLLEK